MRKEQTFRYEEKSKVEQPKVWNHFGKQSGEDWDDFPETFSTVFVVITIGSILLGTYISLWWTDRATFLGISAFLLIGLLYLLLTYVITYIIEVRKAYKKQLKDEED